MDHTVANTRRITVVVNPERADAAAELLELLDDVDADLSVVRPDDAAGIGSAFADAVAGDADVIAAVGGDGTQRTASSELAQTETALLVVPGGTVNLLGRVMGIETVADAADAIRDGRTKVVDTGVVDGETFVLNASSGYDAAVIRRVDNEAKRWGRLGYFVTGLRQLGDDRPKRVTVTVDGEVRYRGRAMSVVVTNFGQRGSASFTLAQGSAPDDGELDVVIQRCDSAATMLRSGWMLVRGAEPRSDDLVTHHGKQIDVEWSTTVASQRDGDDNGDGTTFRHAVVPSSLTVCTPNPEP